MVPASCSWAHALLFGRDNVASQYRQYRAVHRHGHRHLVQGNSVEQDFHVLHRVDGDAGLADIASYPGMIGVVAAVSSKVKGHRHTLSAGSQGLAIKGVGFLGGGEARVLADGPRAAGIHRGLWAADVRRDTRHGVGVLQAFEVGGGVQRFHRNILGGVPGQLIGIAPCNCLVASSRQFAGVAWALSYILSLISMSVLAKCSVIFGGLVDLYQHTIAAFGMNEDNLSSRARRAWAHRPRN